MNKEHAALGSPTLVATRKGVTNAKTAVALLTSALAELDCKGLDIAAAHVSQALSALGVETVKNPD